MKHIYYKNDFAVEITLLNASGEVVAPPEWQWHIEFTDGRRKYICSVEKGNANVVGNTIMCYLDNHKFCCGEIGYKFVQAIPDMNYLDGFQNLITPKALPIELWEQESDNDVNIQSSVVPAYVVYDAYQTAKANGYAGTAEDFYDALIHIVDINKKEAERVEAEANRVSAEQQRVENFEAMESALTTATSKANTATTKAEEASKRADNSATAAYQARVQATLAANGANDISADLEAKREADYWRGAKGEKGDDGVSPTVSTSKTGKVTTIKITDAQGTQTATVNDGESVDVVQSTGTSEVAVMSQKASTDSFIANTPSGDPMHNMYAEVGAIYNDTGKDIERVDQWGDTIIHKAGYWYLNGLGDLTNADMNRCWVYGNCIYHGYKFYISGSAGNYSKTNIPYISNGIPPSSNVYDDLIIANWSFKTFSFNDIAFKNVSKVKNSPLNLSSYRLYNTGTIKFYGWIVCKNIDKYTFYNRDRTECIGLILTTNSYIDLPKLRADCIRQIIEAVRATGDITITLHPEAYERAIADEGVQTALANKTNVSLAKGE